MSQTTRCPSCGTLFKVVADQLRISDGWVRCGHCQLVFDASAHLQANAPAPLLPDMALDRLRAPPAPVRRTEPVERLWGAPEAEPARAPEVSSGPGHLANTLASPLPSADTAAAAPAVESSVQVPVPSGPQADTPSVLHVPEPVVPAFLVQGTVPGGAEEALPSVLASGTSSLPAMQAPHVPPQDPVPTAQSRAGEAGGEIEWPSIELPLAAEAGYELPAPDADTEKAGAVPAPLPEVPALELLPKVSDKAFAPLRSTPRIAEHATAAREPMEQSVEPPMKSGLEPASEKAQDLDLSAPVPAEEAAPPRVAPEPPSVSVAVPGPDGSDDDWEPAEPGVQELSFMRAARRKAFWRKPWVRATLSLTLVAALVLLAAQVAVQERNDLAARIPALRPGLQALCSQWGCALSSRRDIAAVEVDSSSFQKLRGDEYQFSLVLKNRSAIPVAMPAVELTLTDAADQPVLRRVLLPKHWNAPSELAAQGEWSVSRTLMLSPAGARITGYRVVAFYP